MIPLTPIYFTTSPEYTLPEARTQISFLLIFRFDQIYIHILVAAWGTQSRSKLLMKTAFQFELESKLSTGRERFVSFLHSEDVKSLTASSYTIKILQVFLQISQQPYLRSTYWHFTVFTPWSIRQFLSGTPMIWKTWDLSQAHIFTPEHEWEILKPFSREKSLCQ